MIVTLIACLVPEKNISKVYVSFLKTLDSKSYNNLTALKVQYKLAQVIFINLRKADLQ
jgi:hypothetical protein